MLAEYCWIESKLNIYINGAAGLAQKCPERPVPFWRANARGAFGLTSQAESVDIRYQRLNLLNMDTAWYSTIQHPNSIQTFQHIPTIPNMYAFFRIMARQGNNVSLEPAHHYNSPFEHHLLSHDLSHNHLITSRYPSCTCKLVPFEPNTHLPWAVSRTTHSTFDCSEMLRAPKGSKQKAGRDNFPALRWSRRVWTYQLLYVSGCLSAIICWPCLCVLQLPSWEPNGKPTLDPQVQLKTLLHLKTI